MERVGFAITASLTASSWRGVHASPEKADGLNHFQSKLLEKEWDLLDVEHLYFLFWNNIVYILCKGAAHHVTEYFYTIFPMSLRAKFKQESKPEKKQLLILVNDH